MLVTPILAALLALVYVYLSLNVIKYRFRGRISAGDGGNRDLAVAIRIHANFIEYVPFTLILLWFIETVLFESQLVWVLGLLFLVARVLHIFGMKKPKSFLVLRQIGMVVTLTVMLAAAIRIIWHYLPF